MIKTILVDDEPIALKHLANLLGKYCPQLEIMAQANSVSDGIKKIEQLNPELVLLDIELAGERSFEILKQIAPADFELIFVTAYDQFGIQAVKHDATDYILKPINKTELIRAVEKAVKKIHHKRINPSSETPTGMIQKAIGGRLALPTMEGLIFVDIHKVMYCESDGGYTRFHLEENKKILVSKNLGKYESLLPADLFIRVHHHSIVNINYIDKYIKGRGGYVILKNGTLIPVSYRRKENFFDKLV